MLKRTCTLLLGTVFLLVALQAKALDDDSIDRWLASMEELQTWGQDQGELEDDDLRAEDPQDFDFERILAETAEEHDEIREIISRHGFDDAGEWSSVGGRIVHAMMAVQMEVSADMEREMEEAMRELEENPDIPEEQKEQFRRQMEQQMAQISSMFEDVSSEDKAAVERRKADIMAVLE